MVLPDSHGVSRAPRYSGIPQSVSRFCVRAFHPLWKNFPDPSATLSHPLVGLLQPPSLERPGFGLFRVRSPLLTESLLISSPPGTEMFQFSGFASRYRDDAVLPTPGFPIRIPSDQSLFSGSPKLFAADRVLLRLSAPRHPPFALSSLTIPYKKAIGSNRNTNS